MKRNTKALADKTFDIVIIGSGIYGAAAAWDASLRGLSVAIIDKGDFGAATSFNSLKTIHGGLRYLQSLDLKRFRESVRERTALMYMAPHLVHPLPVIMPTYGYAMKGPAVLFAGLVVNDILSFDRNRLDDPEKLLPNGRILKKETCLRMLPGIDSSRVNGAAAWTDAQMYSSERLTLAFVQSAVEKGAEAANYCKAEGIIEDKKRIVGVKARDLLTDECFDIRGKVTLNTAGAWIDDFFAAPDPRVKLSTAMNIIINRPMLNECAAGFSAYYQYPLPNGKENSGSHVLFMAPWRHQTIAGTYHRPYSGHPDEMTVSEEEINMLINEINSGYPNDPVKREDISFAHKGFLPMDGIDPKTGEVVLTKQYKIYDSVKEYGKPGLLGVSGVKYTTARDVAEKLVDMAMKQTGNGFAPGKTFKNRLAGGNIEFFDDFMQEALTGASDGIPVESIRHLVYHYGSEYKKILDYGYEREDLLCRVPEASEVLQAEIIHAVRHEMAVQLSDVVLRRTNLGAGGYPGKAAVKTCANLMAGELKWDKSMIKSQIADVTQKYSLFQG